MYGDCGRMADARAVFDALPTHNLHSWTVLIKGYVKNGCGREALDCFEGMQISGIQPDCVHFTCALDACASLGALDKGQKIHAAIIGSGYEERLIVGTALVNMYGKCGNIFEARSVFRKIPQRDVICWNTMIAVCAQNGHGEEALDFYNEMQCDCVKPNYVTYVSVLDACASLRALQKGQEIHATIVVRSYEGQIVIGTALINMYGKCKSLQDARNVFDRMLQRDVVAWNAIISACAQNAHSKEALEYFDEMQNNGIRPDHVTFACALDACADLVSLEKGQELHAAIINNGYEGHVLVANALINVYGKCGCLLDARGVFYQMFQRDVVSWNAMIAACAHNGHGNEALYYFNEMQNEGTKPDQITFLSVLNACSHTGCIDDGRKYFILMTEDHGLTPKMEHYLCLVDILGRAGHLDEAEGLVNTMSCENKVRVWLCLLGACRIHGDVERGVRAANHVFKLDPNSPAPYVLLSNMLVQAGRLDDARKLRGIEL
ncbi:hypothetical protein O6H91_15G055500 [Diphasiastrum complanatum]|nr:hypothetical protein O6H91_15G055500 [Diphasiastrum complanatum]